MVTVVSPALLMWSQLPPQPHLLMLSAPPKHTLPLPLLSQISLPLGPSHAVPHLKHTLLISTPNSQNPLCLGLADSFLHILQVVV